MDLWVCPPITFYRDWNIHAFIKPLRPQKNCKVMKLHFRYLKEFDVCTLHELGETDVSKVAVQSSTKGNNNSGLFRFKLLSIQVVDNQHHGYSPFYGVALCFSPHSEDHPLKHSVRFLIKHPKKMMCSSVVF